MSEPSTTKRTWLERLTAMLGHEPQTREQLISILRDAQDRDVLTADMLSMIERILHVSELQVREVMVPKARMVVIEKGSTLQEVLSVVIESEHSRFPVVDTAEDTVVGMMLAKDILKYFQDAAKFNLEDITRPAIFTPQSKRLNVLLREFRVNRTHMAIILDEYGHVAGLCTIEDVLEQIVGEIEDEYDIDEKDVYIKKQHNDTFIVKAQTPIETFNDYFETSFDDSDFDTIGGIVLQRFGHMPKKGDVTKMGNHRFKVLEGDSRRIYVLEVKLKEKKK